MCVLCISAMFRNQMFPSGRFVQNPFFINAAELFFLRTWFTWLVTPFFLRVLWTFPRTGFLIDATGAGAEGWSLGLLSCWFPPFMCCSYGSINLKNKIKRTGFTRWSEGPYCNRLRFDSLFIMSPGTCSSTGTARTSPELVVNRLPQAPGRHLRADITQALTSRLHDSIHPRNRVSFPAHQPAVSYHNQWGCRHEG